MIKFTITLLTEYFVKLPDCIYTKLEILVGNNNTIETNIYPEVRKKFLFLFGGEKIWFSDLNTNWLGTHLNVQKRNRLKYLFKKKNLSDVGGIYFAVDEVYLFNYFGKLDSRDPRVGY